MSERQEFTEWAAAHRLSLLRTAVLVTGDHGRAEDLVQEALTKVAQRWRRLRDQRPDAYARRIIVRDNVSRWRRTKLEVVTDEPPACEEIRSESSATERRLILAAALRQLTPKQRAVLVLRYLDDLSEAATAELLGVSVGTVKSTTNLALRRLREAAPELSELLQETS